MIELRKLQVEKHNPKTFDDFHSMVCKSMPNASRFPEMYDLCYDLMKLAWETAKNKE